MTWIRMTAFRALASRGLAALALLLGAAGAPPAVFADGVYRIEGHVWDHYQTYLRTIGSTRPGAFAITVDGGASYFFYCQDIRCMPGSTYSHDAKQHCESAFGTDCVIFAVRDEIKVQYEIRPAERSGSSEGTGGAALEPSPMPSVTLAVTPEVMAEVDKYLRNAQRSGRAWALAIAKDGSSAASANCPIVLGYRAGAFCQPTMGGAQELASREAIKRCGGPTHCLLLYVGAQKTSNIELTQP